ncbi:helix-turn-helix domain-containing protein [uncultured Roseobacter sp.]|uniref:helix-turn-helix transcriptional regulator n=1 Tax=uncultured Roseobacter sp. TaxID=114847 RepID=UPI002626F575|nr:helix-turn-helix domain-containing protein [uncultured Roseobacter sp.]
MLQKNQPEMLDPNDRAYLDGFIDETAAADFLCQSVRTLQKWRVTGEGPEFFKSGRSVRYRRRELNAWAEERRRKHTSK